MALRNRANARGANAKWRKRDSAILLGRAFIAVAAVVGLFALGHQADAAPDRGPMIVRPATTVEKLTHDIEVSIEMENLVSPSASPNGGWGAD